MNLIFGSKALLHWFPDRGRIPNDTDIIGKGVNSNNTEYHWTKAFEYLKENIAAYLLANHPNVMTIDPINKGVFYGATTSKVCGVGDGSPLGYMVDRVDEEHYKTHWGDQVVPYKDKYMYTLIQKVKL